ncbi:hypothetical protein [Arthrobacter sp. efr-133-TYG-120]|uniref:hypothetical protein n=1 Tax=Arthrobacter sp. efr-133-TYG-120 TaxID=3040280 RepID=UPI002550C9E7|nr:hypothetical protein [Arthrobacter sp. efr-133-TYG-120]
MDDAQRVAAKIALGALAADGFLLAGGQALIEHGITERLSDDIDLFALHRRHTPATFAASVQKMTAASKPPDTPSRSPDTRRSSPASP